MHGTMTKSAALIRPVFTTSRLLEFCNIKELTAQTGHGPEEWPLVVIKELIDNSLDICEEHGISPQITIGIENDSLTVADNGPGIAADTIAKVIDYTVRASSREAFVAPTRGAQGNALKTIVAMPYALTGTIGTTTIETNGVRHTITFRADPIRQEPIVEIATDPSFVKIGTRITVRWPETPRSEFWTVESATAKILQMAETYRAINPHLTIKVTEGGEPIDRTDASDPDWSRWQPSSPAPAHWYEQSTFERLIAAYVRDDQDRGRNTLVREFVAQFRGLSGSAKQKAVLESVNASRMTLADFFGSGDAVNKEGVANLLAAMKSESRQVKPADLGVIGEGHLRSHLEAFGAHPETIRYKRNVWDDATCPLVVEAAFGYCEDRDDRHIAIGLNFSPAIRQPIRGLEDLLDECWAGSDDPVMIVLHITCPRFSFTDRGKGSIVLSDPMRYQIANAIRLVTKEWTKQSKAEHRQAAARERRLDRLSRRRSASAKDASYEIMEQAYRKASGPRNLPATATQIMYAARRYIQQATGKQLNRQYFNQTLLPAYMADNPETTSTWDVCYDDRGHFLDPHNEQVIGLGTKAVRQYLSDIGDPEFCDPELKSARVVTRGPTGCYGALLYIEKEGFLDILEHVSLPQRRDIGILSCKGTSVTAARRLADKICHKYQIPLFVLHDFDKAGLSILGTLRRDTHRYAFENDIEVIDLGLRLADVERLGLRDLSEGVFDKGQQEKRAANMHRNGATEAEIAFLLQRRVELNAMTSDQLVQFIEDKLTEHGVKKIVPETQLLEDAYRLFVQGARREEIIRREIAKADTIPVDVPDDLAEQIRKRLEEHPHERWDAAVRAIMSGKRGTA